MADVYSIKKQVAERLSQAVAEIQAAMAAGNINASGRTSASFRVLETEDGLQLVGGGKDTAPIATLEVGRRPGNVPAGFTAILEQWSRDKGLQFETESKRKSFAYLLGRKIAREGTQRYREPQDVYSSVTRQAADDIGDIIKGTLASVITGDVLHTFDVKK